jgi:hypothetical protein
MSKLLEDFSKVPSKEQQKLEDLQDQNPTAKVYRETIKRYINIFLPSYFNPRAIQNA